MDGITLHGRKLKVEWATKEDFKFFGWKWTEGNPSPSPKRGRSPSRSPSRSPERDRSRSPEKKESRSPNTRDEKQNNIAGDDK
mmetsp:Transcript_10330/g.25682  ORF Transcript_10330/g.25682 Transcript_10330/m.25682 type:complete len:83 (+) Transcript_10330:334-582(+)